MQLNEHVFQIVTDFINEIENCERSAELNTAIKALQRFLEEDVNGYFNPADELVYGAFTRLQAVWKLVSEEEKLENPLLVSQFESLYAYLEELYCRDEEPLEESYSNQIEVPDDAFEMPINEEVHT